MHADSEEVDSSQEMNQADVNDASYMSRATATERVYSSALARMAWLDAPTARLTYCDADDSLVVELVEVDAAFELRLTDELLVEFDGNDAGAQPVALYLSQVRQDPTSRGMDLARELLGCYIWGAVENLVASLRFSPADLVLDRGYAVSRATSWREVVRWLLPHLKPIGQDTRDWAIGVEVLPGRITAVLVDSGDVVLDEVVVRTSANDPETVVQAIAASARSLADRHRHPEAQYCPIGVQIGGPVNSLTGVVISYDKPFRFGDDPWKSEPLGERLRDVTGRRVCVFNDAAALAAFEVKHGLGTEDARFALLLVSYGVGAAFVRDGRVADDPMEIGIFAFAPATEVDDPEQEEAISIESKSGVVGIVAAVAAASADVTEVPVTNLGSAVAVARGCPAALDQFRLAGSGLARGIAAIQAVVDPPRWVVYAPSELIDESTPAGAQFVGQLRCAGRYVRYHGLHATDLVTRRLDSSRGAHAAAVALE